MSSGAADTDEALQRKKERYRQELQEQIAEQQRNKKRYSASQKYLYLFMSPTLCHFSMLMFYWDFKWETKRK